MAKYGSFHIQIKEAKPRFKEPPKFWPEVNKIRLVELLLKETIHYLPNFFSKPKDTLEAVTSSPCAYGVFEVNILKGKFGGFTPQRERCTGCFRCVQEYPDVCRVKINPELEKFDPKLLDAMFTISLEARDGKIPIKGMGYKGKFFGKSKDCYDSMLLDFSVIVRPTRDGKNNREYISTLTDLGRKPSFLSYSKEEVKIVELPLPLIFDYLPRDLNNRSVQESVARAASELKTFFISDLEHYLKNSYCIPIINAENLRNIETIIENNSSLILEYSYDDLNVRDKFLDLKDSIVKPESIILAKLEAKESAIEKSVRISALNEADVIHLYSPYDLDSEKSEEFVKTIREVHSALIKEGLRDNITLMASGKILLAEHVAKTIALGADLVAIDLPVLLALQYQFRKDKVIKRNVDVEWGKQRLINMVAAWHEQLIEVLSAMGIKDVRRLRGEMGRIILSGEQEKISFRHITIKDA